SIPLFFHRPSATHRGSAGGGSHGRWALLAGDAMGNSSGAQSCGTRGLGCAGGLPSGGGRAELRRRRPDSSVRAQPPHSPDGTSSSLWMSTSRCKLRQTLPPAVASSPPVPYVTLAATVDWVRGRLIRPVVKSARQGKYAGQGESPLPAELQRVPMLMLEAHTASLPSRSSVKIAAPPCQSILLPSWCLNVAVLPVLFYLPDIVQTPTLRPCSIHQDNSFSG
ncbi:unnamed protein product, partial [Urochloa humidicola]